MGGNHFQAKETEDRPSSLDQVPLLSLKTPPLMGQE